MFKKKQYIHVLHSLLGCFLLGSTIIVQTGCDMIEYHPKTCYFSITNLYMVWLWNISPGANAVEGNCGLFGLS